MERFGRILDAVRNIASRDIPGWLCFILVFLILIEVISRYVFGSPLMIGDEMGAYIVVAISFMGLAYTWKERGHVRIEFVVTRLPAKVREWLRLITLIMIAALDVVLVKASYDLIKYSALSGTRSGTWLRTPQQWPQMVLIIGTSLLLLQMIIELVKAVKAVRTPERIR